MPLERTQHTMGLSRREVLLGAAGALGTLWIPGGRGVASGDFKPDAGLRTALDASPYVYICPLHPDGQESRCHGEVWFFHDQGDVVIATGSDRWKTRALRKGWEQARIWVGDHGRVKSDADGFRKAASFRARARLEPDRAAFDRLLAAFGKKYPEEWDKWEPRFREGYADAKRVLIRYQPIAS